MNIEQSDIKNSKQFFGIVTRNIKSGRIKTGLKQKEVADILCCPREYISAWERNLKPIATFRLVEMACLFGTNLEVLTSSSITPKLTGYQNFRRGRLDILIDFSSNLKDNMDNKGILPDVLWEKIMTSKQGFKISRQGVKLWINGGAYPGAFQCYRLSRMLNLKFDDMFPILNTD